MHKVAKVIVFATTVFLSSCGDKTENKKETTPNLVVKEKYETIQDLPKAQYYNTNLELEMIKTANNYQNKHIVSEVIITSPRWSSTFNEAGIVTARTRNATIVVNKGEECLLQNVVFEQKKEGNKFLESTIIENKGWQSFKCDLAQIKNPDVIVGVTL